MLFIVKDNDIIEIIEKEFVDENEFREILLNLVSKFPLILVAKREREETPSLLFNPVKEFPTNAGPIDLFFIDNEYYIYIIETKLYRSNERRRAISQVMDYVASLWSQAKTDFDKILDLIKEKTGKKFTEDEARSIKESLINGSFEVIVAFDRIDDNIKSIIDFLNEMAEFDIYAISLRKLKSDDITVLSYEMYPEFKPQPTTIPRKKFMWDEGSFFEKVKENLREGDYEVVRKLYDSLKEIFGEENTSWGRGRIRGSFKIKIPGLTESKDIVALYTDGVLEIKFANMYGRSEEYDDVVDRLAKALYSEGFIDREINHKNYREEGKQYPIIPIARWRDKLNKLIEILSSFIKDIKQLQD